MKLWLKYLTLCGLAVVVSFCRPKSSHEPELPAAPVALDQPRTIERYYEGYLAPLGMDRQGYEPLASTDPMVFSNQRYKTFQDIENPAQSAHQSGSDPCDVQKVGELRPLRCVSVPRPTHTDIKDQAAAIVLGKAFFWDIQVGSDGKTACATCHFSGGVDKRVWNTLNPGPDGLFQSGGVTGPDQLFAPSLIESDDRVGSQGVVRAKFIGLSPDPRNPVDQCEVVEDTTFKRSRQVTGRNTPSNIGAVFYRQLFWDGRAHQQFNGNDPFGSTQNAKKPAALCENCALASQAVGPATNDVEMSCTGRAFNGPASVGAKILARVPLFHQRVSPADSVLGSYVDPQQTGLVCDRSQGKLCTYQDLIDRAFDPAMASHAQENFSRIWGQALLAYQATLIPDRTPFDQFMDGNHSALTPRQQLGLEMFRGKARCTECHEGAELSDASLSYFKDVKGISDDKADVGFHNLGLRPTREDLGRAGLGPMNISFAEGKPENNRGAFKTAMLRNVKLTAPYFHNGSKHSLEEVVRFYSRGGDFKSSDQSEDIRPFSLSEEEFGALVEFLREGLTDHRVELQLAPFDHPALPFPSGVLMQATGGSSVGPLYYKPDGQRVANP